MLTFLPDHMQVGNWVVLALVGILLFVVNTSFFAGEVGDLSTLFQFWDTQKPPNDEEREAMCKQVGNTSFFLHVTANIMFFASAIAFAFTKSTYDSHKGWSFAQGVLDFMQLLLNLYLVVALSHTQQMAAAQYCGVPGNTAPPTAQQGGN